MKEWSCDYFGFKDSTLEAKLFLFMGAPHTVKKNLKLTVIFTQIFTDKNYFHDNGFFSD